MYLVDTNVLSAGVPGTTQTMPDLIGWMERNSERLYLSVVTVAEVAEGIAKSRRQGATLKADRLAAWLETLLHLYGDRILPFDIAVARLLGEMSDRARAAGQTPGFADLAIAATGVSRGYTVLTRNMRHFRPLGIKTQDPFDSLPNGIG